MHICIILVPALLALSLAGVVADIIAPRYPKLENFIYNLLDRIM